MGTFHLARHAPAQVLSLRVMHFGFRETAAAISVGALIFCCSCEKHSLGEDPEVQKEHVGEAKSDENAATANKADVPESAASNRTPAEFFPKTTPSP